jgi:hypothetical protein
MGIFKHLILNGRVAGGKSEFIDFLKKLPPKERTESCHIGSIVELDDFLYLQEKFIEDDLWEKTGNPRLHSEKYQHYYLMNSHSKLLDLCYEKFNYFAARDYLNNPKFYETNTLFIEFSRGTPDGGYERAYNSLSPEILNDAAITYISVSYEESIRKNEARYKEKLKLSTLAHKVPDKDMVRWNKEQDWEKITDRRPHGYMTIKGIKVPFVTIYNEPELTDPIALAERYGTCLRTLMELYKNK